MRVIPDIDCKYKEYILGPTLRHYLKGVNVNTLRQRPQGV
jgi:hypothetical protein